ncbi:MAG TPA: MarR family transcriptional regulator [Ktedonobacterales bacterium]
MAATPPVPPERDLVMLLTALHAGATAAVTRRLDDAGFADLRPAHGYVFQHLVEGPMRVTELARKLGMTAQGASKSVIELERMGYVVRQSDPGDQRNRPVALTQRGWEAIEAARVARAAVNAELMKAAGPGAGEELMAMLQRLAERTGGLRELLARRLRPER